MDRQYVSSTAITSIGYDVTNSILEIEFKSSGEVWQYYDFPESSYYEMMATSHGKYFHANVRGRFREARVQ